eukprot:TRINITY_DN6878_c0_g1_i1.p1 TRINITY_DN6878_c0_g1~~TRINITY_DN6878_c0_g1_i1.p1  ORF type:complete len:499 (-),score=105.59 TRINITY_DN6878_c0_g1_i1:45-1541(-)
MRQRGSSLCDFAILIIDVSDEELKQQTIESIELLVASGTPFLVVINKIDTIPNWKPIFNLPVREAVEHQEPETGSKLKRQSRRIRQLLRKNGINSAPYWKINDLQDVAPVVPAAVRDGVGISDIILFSTMFCQTILSRRLIKKDKLECNIMEVEILDGLGPTVDVILTNGKLKRGDKLVLCGLNGPILTSIRSILVPEDMKEMKSGSKYNSHCKEVEAVCGVKLWAKNLEEVVSGSSVFVYTKKDSLEVLKTLVMEPLSRLYTRIPISSSGVHVQCSTLGSLEALLEYLNNRSVAVGSFSIGRVNVRHVKKCSASSRKTILAFDVDIHKQARKYAYENGVTILQSNVIYDLLEQFKSVLQLQRNFVQAKSSSPVILSALDQYVQRRYKPIIIGFNIEYGRVNLETILYLSDGTKIGRVTAIKGLDDNIALESANYPNRVVLKIEESELVFGRDMFGGDRCYSKLCKRDFLRFKAVCEEMKLIHAYRKCLKMDINGDSL